MAKRSNNNSSGRRIYGEKPYDMNNSFVKKMATKVTDLIPQRSWISKWFNSPGEPSNEGENPDDQDMEEETLQPPSKRPRIRMDMIHPPGTFSIKPRNRPTNTNHEVSHEEYPLRDETLDDFLQPSMVAGTSRAFASSTPAIRMDSHNPNPSRSNLNNLVQRPQNNLATNGTDDNSESSESTSGCSSLIPQANRQESHSNFVNSTFPNAKNMDDKLSFTNHLQSRRSLFLNDRESLSSRRPSFNASIVTNNDTSAIERSNSTLSSPFYSGNTTFGGSNAILNFRKRAGQQRSSHDYELKVPRRTSIRVKPSNTPAVNDATGMSQTAKRILEALEHFSSPISDAKKIPVKTPLNNSLSTGRKRAREEELPPTSRVGLRHLTRELAIPTVPDMLKLKRRQRLQDTTLAARKIVSANIEKPPALLQPTTATETAPKDYYIRTQDDSREFLGKLRAKSKKKFDPEEDEPVETVNLPSIPLPITNLPKFDIPLPTSKKNPVTETTIQSKDPQTTEETKFTFSSPIKFNETTNNVKSINHFSFSEPIIASRQKDNSDKITDSNDKKSIALSFTSTTSINNSDPAMNSTSSQPSMNFMWSSSSTAPRPKEKKIVEKTKEEVEECSGGMVVAKELKSGSVMDILGSLSNKVETNIWECGDCFIKNNGKEEQCVACKARKPDSAKKILSSTTKVSSGGKDGQFSAQFKLGDEWECPSCLVKNPKSETKCSSCLPSKEEKKLDNKIASSFTVSNSTKSDPMDKFKPAKGSWECPGCMLRNSSTVIACPCCGASKPDLVKQTVKSNSSELKNNDKSSKTPPKLEVKTAPNSWECPSCMVRNDAAASSCVCCTTPCPGAKTQSTSTATVASNATGFGDKFKKPEGTWTCDTCMVPNKADVDKCVACESLKPGTTAKSKTGGSSTQFDFGIPSNSTQFKFGVPKTDEKKPETSTNGFTFGIPTTQQSTAPFSFGIPTTEKTQAPTGFTFTSPKTTETPAAKTNSSNSTPSVGGFSFGVSKANESKSSIIVNEPAAKSTPFVFGVTKTDASNEASGSSTTTTTALVTQASTDKSIEAKKPTTVPAFSFVAPGSVSTTAESNNVLANSTATSSIANQAPFTFSAPKQSAPSGSLINFGQNSSSGSSQISTVSGFSFAEPKVTDSTQVSASETKPIISFGATSTPLSGLTSPSSASTGAKEKQNTNSLFPALNVEQKPTSFGIEDKVSAFGEPKPPSTAPPAFGSDKSVFNTPTPSFGTTPASSGTPGPFGNSSTPSVFGSTTVPTFGTSTAPSSNFFGAVKPAEQPAATLGFFTFGAEASQPSAPATNEGFNFTGNTGATPAASKTGFGFGNPDSVAAGQTPAASGFGTTGFGATASNSVSTTAFSFNAPKPNFGGTGTTSFGSSSTPNSATPTFSATPASTGGFNFGTPAPATGSSGASVPGGFNFNAGITPATPSGGFNFNAPSPSPSVAFDPNTTPRFNFTGGSAPTMFNATPAVSGRKIKKARRRGAQGTT